MTTKCSACVTRKSFQQEIVDFTQRGYRLAFNLERNRNTIAKPRLINHTYSMPVPHNLLNSPTERLILFEPNSGTFVASELSTYIKESLSTIESFKKVLLILPDSTRSCPLPTLLPEIYKYLYEKSQSITALIALGTHSAMNETDLNTYLAGKDKNYKDCYPGIRVINHEWWKPETFVEIGKITSKKMTELSAGKMNIEVPILINKEVVEADIVIIIGPVFPHEVVGFSGGTKYLFPGVSGKEMINASHWLGALISSSNIIGKLGVTPVREMINYAASFVHTPIFAFCLVVETGTGALSAISFGRPHSAWERAAELSSKLHIEYIKGTVDKVISVVASRYIDIWTAAKGMYKVDPVIADGGEVVLYAPHVTEFAYSHKELDEIGYHCMEYFTKQWDMFKKFPAGVLAHSTHLRGSGIFSLEEGEKCRITVTLATGISKERTEQAGLKYQDFQTIDLVEIAKDSNVLLVHNAGETLYRVKEKSQ